MAEQIEMPFGLCNGVDPRKHVLHGVHIGATGRIRLNRPCSGGPNEAGGDAALCQITLTTYYFSAASQYYVRACRPSSVVCLSVCLSQ